MHTDSTVQCISWKSRLSPNYFDPLTVVIPRCQAEGLDGGKRWKNEKVAEEKAPAAGFGSPSKGQAINLLDTVSAGISSRTKHLVGNTLQAVNILTPFSLLGSASRPQAELQGAEGL